MGSHHHLCHQLTTTSYCHGCYPYSPCNYTPPPPPPPPPPDCHLHHPPPPQPDCRLHPPPPPPPDCHPHHPTLLHLHSAQTHRPNLHQYHPHFQERSFQEDRKAQQTVSSLLSRIAALESSLRSRSSSSRSLREAAARTIQTHFRAFLLLRSRTLRNLKDLASIKSKLKILKSSFSEKTHFDYDVIYNKTLDLLLKLDTIQGGDPMIREGKSSIRRELNKFLDFIDGFYMERQVISSGVNVTCARNSVKYRSAHHERKMGNVKCGGLKSDNSEKLRELVERIYKLAEELDEGESKIIESPKVKKHGVSGNKNGGLVKQLCGVQPKVKKSVTFSDNGKVYRVFRRNPEPVLDEDYDNDFDMGISVNARRDIEDDLCRKVEEIGVALKEAEDDNVEEAHSENGGSVSSSDDEKESRGYLRSEDNFERKMYNQFEAGNFAFSAPLPLRMETRTDIIDKRKQIS